MSERQIKEYYERIEKLLNGANKETYGFAPQEIKNILRSYEELQNQNQELKKQLEEWNHHLKCSKEMLDIQGHNGNYNYDSYMLGIYNGMEYIIALFETREPIFKSGKDIEFISDKTQQKEFIEYLEEQIKDMKEEIGNSITKSYKENHIIRKNVYQEILSKYKEIIGVSDETNNN